MRSTPSVQRLPFSTARAAGAPVFVRLVRFEFFVAVAALMLVATSGRDAPCGCVGGGYVADVSAVRVGDVGNATDNDLPAEEETESMSSVTADPAAATGGGGGGGGSGGGGEPPVVSPRPCPTYASPEAMAAAAAS